MNAAIGTGRLRAVVSSFGAELVGATLCGKERLWQNENGSWNKHAPVLFPVCGHFGVTVGGVRYPMPPHGFASKREFTLAEHGADTVRLELKSDTETRRLYPYEFRFSVVYRTEDDALRIVYEVENPSDDPLLFACGGHESYALGDDIGAYSLVFPREERFTHLCHDAGGFLTGERLELGCGREFPLPGEMLRGGASVIFGGIRSEGAELRKRTGEPVASLTFGGLRNLLLWRPDGARTVCVEPWSCVPDLAGANDPEFSQKEGVLFAEPHGTRRVERVIRYA